MGSLSGVERANAFYDRLVAEVLDNDNCLGPSDYACLSHYYEALEEKAALRSFYRYNWTRRVAPMAALVLALPRRDVAWRILDAGCGVGTESIFWSSLREDVEVIGVDISPDRLAVAKARQAAYERRLGRCLDLRFWEQDVLNAPKGEGLDLVWAMESISHIDPAQEFLTKVYQSLNPGGALVLSDSHLLNPAMLWRVFRLRVSGVEERIRKELPGGGSISYAQERLFSVGRLSRMSRRAGFRSVQSQLGIFFPPLLARFSFALQACIRLDALLTQVPLVRNLGGIYTIVAHK
jgi:SAM-dependent methyltransferase